MLEMLDALDVSSVSEGVSRHLLLVFEVVIGTQKIFVWSSKPDRIVVHKKTGASQYVPQCNKLCARQGEGEDRM